MIVTNVGRGAVDAGSAENERYESVRRSRVVLTPRRWRRWRAGACRRRGKKARSPGRARSKP